MFTEGIAELSFEQLSILLVLRSDHSHPIETELGIIAENTLKPVKSSEAIQLHWFSELHVKTVGSQPEQEMRFYPLIFP